MEYVIVGDTEKYKGCLVYVCGANKEDAEKALKQLQNNPDEQDKEIMKTHSNFRIEAVEDKYCWWNDPFLAN